MNRRAPDASRMKDFIKTVSAQKSKLTRILDLQSALRETPRVMDGKSSAPGAPVIPNGYDLVDEVPLKSLNPTFSRVLPDFQLLVCQSQDFSVNILEIFEEAVLSTIQLTEPLIDAFTCQQKLVLVCRSKVAVINIQSKTKDFLNLQITEQKSCQCSAGSLDTQKSLGPAHFASHESAITAATATSKRVFLADIRGRVAEIIFTSGLPEIKVLSSKIRQILFGNKEKIIQLVADKSRDLLFSLTETGDIEAYHAVNDKFFKIKGKITQKDAIAIHAVPASMSASICLASIDSHGKTSFYTLNDQISSHFTEIQDGVESIEILELKKCYDQKISPVERIACTNFRIDAGRFYYFGADEVEYFGVDQSITRSGKPFGVGGTVFRGGSEQVLDVRSVWRRLPFVVPALGAAFQELQAFQCELVQSQRFLVVVTAERMMIFCCLKIHQLVRRLLARYEADAVRELLSRFLDEIDVIELFLTVSCEADRPDVAQQLQLTRRCLVQFTMDELQAPRPGKSRQVLDEYIKFKPQLFVQAAVQLLGKLLSPVFNYQLFYSPFNYFRQNVEIDKNQIPIRNLITQQYLHGTANSQVAVPVTTFSYVELFNLGVFIQNVYSMIERDQSLLSIQKGPGTGITSTNPLFNQKSTARDDEPLSGIDLAGCSVYVKELLYFFSLCFNPINSSRVVPELMQLSNNTQTGQTELPVFSYGNYFANSNQYITTPALTFQYYLDAANKQDMEVLVRKLNLILNQQQNKNIYRLNQQQYQESFDRVFSTMCKYLSKIYVNRLQALQDLEQAASCHNQHEKAKRVNSAVKQLKSARSLAPVEPLVEVFTKADAVKDLVTLILHTYNGQIQQLNGYLKRTNYQSLYSDFQAQVQRFKALYNQQSVSYAFSMQAGVQVPPYTIDPLLNTSSVTEAITCAAQQFRVDLTAQSGQPDTSALKEAADVLEHIFKMIQSHFVYNGLSQVMNNFDTGASVKEHQQRGLSVILAAVQGNTCEIWHILLYEYLYLHYIAASCYLDLAQKKQQAVRDGGKAVQQCLTIIQQRCQSALIDIRSPYIEQFLLGIDYELYIKQLRKQKRYSQLLVYIKQLIEGGVAQAILPNSYENGVFSTSGLDFQQTLQLIQLACTVSRYSSPAVEGSVGGSIFNASVTGGSVGNSMGASLGASMGSQEQFREYFGTQLELASVQERFLMRLRAQGAERDAAAASRSLWSPVQLQQRLSDARAVDLQLQLQYNVIRRLRVQQFSDSDISLLYDQLFAAASGNVAALAESAEKLLALLNVIALDPVGLKLPIYKLVSTHLPFFQQDPEQASSIITTTLFRPSGTQKPYKFIGNFVRGTMLLLQDYKNNGAMAEALGWLAVKLVDISRNIIAQAPDDEILTPGRVLERVRQVCPTAPRLQAALRRFG